MRWPVINTNESIIESLKDSMSTARVVALPERMSKGKKKYISNIRQTAPDTPKCHLGRICLLGAWVPFYGRWTRVRNKKTKYENKLNLLESKRCQFENVMWAWNDDISKCLGWSKRRENIPINMLGNELMDQRYMNWVFDEPTWLRIGAVCANVRFWYLK